MYESERLIKPLIFIGSGRSGTTIISEIIDRHPDIAYPSTYQERFPKLPILNWSRNLYENSLWTIYAQKKQLNKVHPFNKYMFRPTEGYRMWDYLTPENVDFTRGFLLDDQLSPAEINKIRKYFDKTVKYQNRSKLSFKITGPPRISFLKQIFPDARFVGLSRNPIATISSLIKVNFWEERGMHRLWWTGAYSPDEKNKAKSFAHEPELMTAFQIKKLRDTTEEEVKKNSVPYINVTYEDFVEDPSSQIERILEFAELSTFDYQSYLDKVSIINRNKDDEEYFSAEKLNKIYSILND